MNKILLAVLFLIFILSNLFWYIEYHRMKNRNIYHLTEVCELRQLVELNANFELGMSKSNFIDRCESINMICTEIQDLININLDSGCPASGRPYCGFNAMFQSDKLVTLEPGYPCH